MSLLSQTILAFAVVNDVLHAAAVRRSPLGSSVAEGGSLDRAQAESPDRLRGACKGLGSPDAVVLVCPSEWCAIRPMGLSPQQFDGALPELRANLRSLLPLSGDNAMLGYIGRTSADGPAGGYLIGVDLARLSPWLDIVSRGLGRPVDQVLAPPMALLGLGLQSEPEAVVFERLTSGAVVSHRLRAGEIEELSSLARAESTGSVAARSLFDSAMPGITPTSPGQFAAAGALASMVAAPAFRPFAGRRPARSRRWIPAAAGFAAALLCVVLAGQAQSWRVDRGIAALDDKALALATQLEDARRAHDEARRLIALLRAADAALPRGAAVLPDLLAARTAVPAEGFLYRVELDGGSATLRGEARRSGDVLRSVEQAAEFQAAREMDAPIAVEERGTEMFHVRAERVGSKGAAAP